MGLEAATFIGQLTPTNPTGTDPKGQGDDHIRLIKQALQNTFPGLNFSVTFSSFAVTFLDENSATSVQTVLDVPGLGANNTLTGTLQLNFSDNGTGPQYRFDLRSASTTPATDDDLIEPRFIGVNDAGSPEDIAYASFGATIKDKTDGSEDGEFYVKTAIAGAVAKRLKIGAGVYTPNATDGDKGADSINAKHFYKDGTEVDPQKSFVRYYAEYTANADLGTIPVDDTTPEIGEGTEILTKSVVIPSATARMRWRVQGEMASASLGNGVVSVFQDSTLIDARVVRFPNSDGSSKVAVFLEGEIVPGAAATVMLSVRAGGDVTARFNGSGSARLLGGAQKTTLVVEVWEP